MYLNLWERQPFISKLITFHSSLIICPKSWFELQPLHRSMFSANLLYTGFTTATGMITWINNNMLKFWLQLPDGVSSFQSGQCGPRCARKVWDFCQPSCHVVESVISGLSYLSACCFHAQENRIFIFSSWISSLLVLRQSDLSIL